MRILSWNVNGLRSVIAKGALGAVLAERPDVLCLQEVKAREEQVGRLPAELPHRFFAPARRPGYSGTAILSRIPVLSWREGMGYAASDDEGRLVTAELPSLFVVSVYVPNSRRGLPRLPFRLQWDRRFRAFLQELARVKPVVFCGDMNVAHEEIDIARPRENVANPGFTPWERRSFSRLLGTGFVDSFRALHPEGDRYTWWSLASRARERNVGWRIDYVCLSEALRGRLRDAFIREGIMGSDHCPVGVELSGRA